MLLVCPGEDLPYEALRDTGRLHAGYGQPRFLGSYASARPYSTDFRSSGNTFDTFPST